MIKVKSLSKSYGEKKVLTHLDLEIKENKFTMILGANGAGKSTLMNILGRLLPFQNGEIYYHGIPMKSFKANDFSKKCAILKQSNFIQLKLTVNELVAFGRYPYSKGKLSASDHEIIDEVMKWCSCEDFRNSYFNELSGGQRQRVLLAMILAQDSDVILLDEPTSNLDLKQTVTMMKLLRDVVSLRHKTVVMIVHDINIASMFADEIILMKDGKCLYQGDVSEILDAHHLSECYEIDFVVETLQDRKISYIK